MYTPTTLSLDRRALKLLCNYLLIYGLLEINTDKLMEQVWNNAIQGTAPKHF